MARNSPGMKKAEIQVKKEKGDEKQRHEERQKSQSDAAEWGEAALAAAFGRFDG